MNKLFIVLQREYLTRVKKKSFIIFTLLMPIFFVAIVAIPAILSSQKSDTSEETVVIIDSTGQYADLLSQDKTYNFVTAKESGLEAYRQVHHDIPYAYVVISDDLLHDPSALTIYAQKQLPKGLEQTIRSILTPVLRDQKINSFNIPELKQIIDQSKFNLTISTIRLEKGGEEQETSSLLAQIVGQVFTFLIYTFILMYGMMVMQSVREEKKNRIVEIIVSSVRPTTLLFGKIIAIGLVGITQLLLWLVFILVIILFSQVFLLGSVTFDPSLLVQNIQGSSLSGTVNPNMVGNIINAVLSLNFVGLMAAFIFYFFFGYLSYAAIYAALASGVDNDEDVNQMILPITMLLVFSLYCGIFSASNPDAPLAIWSSFIPFSSPVVMMVRLPFEPPIWQIALSCIILVASTALFIWIAAKIYRIGILMYGKKPGFKDLYRWFRYK